MTFTIFLAVLFAGAFIAYELERRAHRRSLADWSESITQGANACERLAAARRDLAAIRRDLGDDVVDAMLAGQGKAIVARTFEISDRQQAAISDAIKGAK